MRFWSKGTLVVLCATLIVASELGEAMLLLPILVRRAAARKRLSEKLLNEINQIDFLNLSGQSIRRRSTTTEGSDDEDERLSREVAATTPQTDFSAHEQRGATAPADKTATRLGESSVAPLLKNLPKVDLFGDSDWPPRPRRQRKCEAKMMAGLSGMRIMGKLAKCLDNDGIDGDGKQSETNWKLEGPIAEFGDFYLKPKPGAQKFTAKVERLIDDWLKKGEKTGLGVARTSLVRTEHLN